MFLMKARLMFWGFIFEKGLRKSARKRKDATLLLIEALFSSAIMAFAVVIVFAIPATISLLGHGQVWPLSTLCLMLYIAIETCLIGSDIEDHYKKYLDLHGASRRCSIPKLDKQKALLEWMNFSLIKNSLAAGIVTGVLWVIRSTLYLPIGAVKLGWNFIASSFMKVKHLTFVPDSVKELAELDMQNGELTAISEEKMNGALTMKEIER